MPRLILTPWRDEFLLEVRQAKRSILLVSPYMKFNVVSAILREIGRRDLDVRTVTRCKTSDLAAGASDIDAIYALSGIEREDHRLRLRIDDKLHAKIFLFDERIAFIGSSNITFSGLQRNYEAVVAIEEPSFVASLSAEAARYWETATPATAGRLEMALAKLKTFVRVTPAAPSAAEHYAATVEDAEPVDEPIEVQDAAISRAADAAAERETREPAFIAAPRITTHTFRRGDLGDDFDGFLAILHNRFETPVPPSRVGLALAAFTSDYGTYLKACEDLAPARPAFIPLSKNEFADLRPIGKAAWEFGLLAVGARAGILRRYGPSGMSAFVQTVSAKRLIETSWDQNLFDAPWSQDPTRASGDVKTSCAYRLFAVVAILRGAVAAANVVAGRFDPIDLLGDDLVDMTELKDAKTRLQEAAQAKGRVATYDGYDSTGADHEREWRCHVRVGGTSRFEGRGKNKGAAETVAAEALLAWMWEEPDWRIVLLLERQRAVDGTRRAGPWRMRSDRIATALAQQVAEAFRADTGLDLPDDVIFPAFIDRGARTRMRLDIDNQALAFAGAGLINVTARLQAARRGIASIEAFMRQVWGSIGRSLPIDHAWALVGVPRDANDAMRTTIVQALAGGMMVHLGRDRAIVIVDGMVGGITPAAASLAPTVATGTGVFAEMTDGLGEAADNTERLQRLAQAHGCQPKYATTRSGSDHAPVFKVIVKLGVHGASAEGSSKRAARNRAAFELLLELREKAMAGGLDLAGGDGVLASPTVEET